jgi:K+-transporting ATPase ATPase C chain
MRLPSWIAQHLAALRALLVMTVLVGLLYPLAMVAIARIPGLRGNADGSLLERDGTVVGSSLIGQSFADADGNPLPQYFQSRPSAAGDGYDPTSTSASNLGPEDVVDELPDPADPESGSQSLLTQVCARSKAIGELEHVNGSRPFCTPDGVGAVLAVFRADGLTGTVTRAVSVNQACPATPFVTRYEGVTVECANPGEDYSAGVVTPIRGSAPSVPAVPADAVTASGSGLDPHISPAYASLQAPRIAQARNISLDEVRQLIEAHTTSRFLGFMGEPTVNVLELNLDLDARHPVS